MMDDIKVYEDSTRIVLTGAERQWASSVLDRLILSFNELEKYDTDKAAPLITVLDIDNIFREDKVIKEFTREDLMSAVPAVSRDEAVDSGYYPAPITHK